MSARNESQLARIDNPVALLLGPGINSHVVGVVRILRDGNHRFRPAQLVERFLVEHGGFAVDRDNLGLEPVGPDELLIVLEDVEADFFDSLRRPRYGRLGSILLL